jgi:hypothetical protein
MFVSMYALLLPALSAGRVMRASSEESLLPQLLHLLPEAAPLQVLPGSPARPLHAARAPRAAAPLAVLPDDMQANYRLLGIGEDAQWGEITGACADLATKYAGDSAKLAQVEAAKEQIQDFLLQQRLKGNLQSTSAAAARSSREITPKGPRFVLPPALEKLGILELPSRFYLLSNLGLFAVIGLMPTMSVGLASTSVAMGFPLGVVRLYNRGAPEKGEDESGYSARPVKKRPVLLAVGITLLAGVLGGALGNVLGGAARRLAKQEVCICLGAAFGWFVSATFFKVQDE